MPVGNDTALRGQENVNRKGLDAAICLRHAGNADVAVVLDVSERSLDQCGHPRVVGNLDIEQSAVTRLQGKHTAIGLFNLAADASWLLRESRCREKQSNGGGG